MSAFDDWWRTYTHTATEGYHSACKAAFSAALEHAAKICDAAGIDYKKTYPEDPSSWITAEEIAEAIRKEIK